MMSCLHNRQSKEIDSVNLATSVPGPEAKRPLRETGEDDFIRELRREFAVNSPESHALNGRNGTRGVLALDHWLKAILPLPDAGSTTLLTGLTDCGFEIDLFGSGARKTR
jgi:hypothetical protein